MSLPAASSWSGARYAGVLLVATVLILVAIAGGCSLADTCPNYSPLSTRSLPLSVQSAVELSAVDQSNMKLRLNDTQIQRNDTVVPEIRQIVRVEFDQLTVPKADQTHCVHLEVTEPRWLVAASVIVNHPIEVHHLALFLCSGVTPVDTAGYHCPVSQSCGILGLDDAFLGWTSGMGGDQKNYTMPEGVGLALHNNSYFRLELHNRLPMSRDRSGVQLVLSDQMQQHEYIHFVWTKPFFSIPPGAEQFAVKLDVIPPVMRIFWVTLHAHQLARKIKVELILQNHSQRVLIVEGAPNTQHKLVPSFEIPSGSTIQVTCWYDNPGASAVHAGPSATENEMCDVWVSAYEAY